MTIDDCRLKIIVDPDYNRLVDAKLKTLFFYSLLYPICLSSFK
jgi:hypothetical protein